MTPIEIIAFVAAVMVIVKMAVLLFKPGKLRKAPEFMFKLPVVAMILYLAVAALLLNFLLAQLTIVQIFVSGLFMMMLVAASWAAYSKGLLKAARKMLKDKKYMKRAWLPSLAWTALAVWVIYAIFA
jgi:hypothetical protein